MIDNWIRPDYLEERGVGPIREAFDEGRERVAWFDDFLMEEKAAALAALFEERHRFEEVFAVRDQESGEVYEMDDAGRFMAAPPEARMWSHWRLIRRGWGGGLSAALAAYLKFQNLLLDPSMLQLLERATGIRANALVGVEANDYVLPHHCLAEHADLDAGRVLCCVFYLSRGWRPEYGLRFQKYHDRRLIRTVEPLWNRLLVFKPQGAYTHAIEPRTEAGRGWHRPGIVWWYRFDQD